MRKILFVLFLLVSSCVNAQEFVNINGSNLYPSFETGAFIPPSSDYALLEWRLEPSLNITSGPRTVTSARIINRVDYRAGFHGSAVGWYESFGDDYSTVYTIIDSEKIYYRSGTGGINSRYLSEIQSLLSSQGLGTVEQRQAYIASFSLHGVQIIDPNSIFGSFTDLLGPWAFAGVGLAIALLALDFGFRHTKKTLGQAAKEARAAERKVINAQIRADGIAQAYRTRLTILAQAKRGDLKVKGMSQRRARQAFYDTARDYADYKKSKGWTL